MKILETIERQVKLLLLKYLYVKPHVYIILEVRAYITKKGNHYNFQKGCI